MSPIKFGFEARWRALEEWEALKREHLRISENKA
jgi:hypothetical protein